MQLYDQCVTQVMLSLSEGLKTKASVSFNDVVGSKRCRKYSVGGIGKSLELLRRYGMVKATSRFGCSELLEFNATEITEKGRIYLSEI